MDSLTPQECQAIIDSISSWEPLHVTKKLGGELKFKQAPIIQWGNKYPYILHELVLRYDVGDYCTLHIDSKWRNINPRLSAYAVWITPLNDDYEGGELYFDGKLVEQVVGVPNKYKRTIPHEITPVTQGTRYSLVSWLFLPVEDARNKNTISL